MRDREKWGDAKGLRLKGGGLLHCRCNFSEAMEQISKNPEMVSQATEMMKNMSPEEGAD